MGGDKEEDSGLTREEQQEQERLRWDGMGGRNNLDNKIKHKDIVYFYYCQSNGSTWIFILYTFYGNFQGLTEC